MGATDIRGNLNEHIEGAPNSIGKRMYAVVDLAAEDSGILTVATHKLMNIPVGHAVVSGSVTILTELDGASGATIQFGLNNGTKSGVLSSAITAQASTDVYWVINLYHNDFEDTVADHGYIPADGTQQWLEMIVGTAALTAGKFVVCLDLLDLRSLTV